MNPGQHSIFRDDAVRRYMQSRVEPVLPRFGRGRNFMLMWALVILSLSCGFALCWWAKVPVYATGYAVTSRPSPESQGAADAKWRLVIFVPPEYQSRLRAGQRLSLRGGAQGQVYGGSLVAVEPALSSPEAARERYGLSACAVPAQTQAAAVALAEVAAGADRRPAGAQAESVYRADVEVGVRRVGALLPVVGRLFGG